MDWEKIDILFSVWEGANKHPKLKPIADRAMRELEQAAREPAQPAPTPQPTVDDTKPIENGPRRI